MTEQTTARPALRERARAPRFRISAGVVLAAAIALIVWLAVRQTGGSSPSSASNVMEVAPNELAALAASVRHPVFWLGPRRGYSYELTRTSNGSIYVRYLPRGVKLGTKEPYLTVATYPFAGAFQAIQSVAKQKGVTVVKLAHRGLGEFAARDPKSVHAAYPGVDYQVEIFDPTPGSAFAVVAQGDLSAFGSLARASSAAPGTNATAASVAQLRLLARRLRHPIYWAGARTGYTYELTATHSGQVYIRYLPPGANVGSKTPYLTVATYPYPRALAATRAVAGQPGNLSVKLARGGLAVVDTHNPKSIHLAFPGSDLQIEVFDPSAATARQIVSSGQVKAIG